MGLDYHFDGPYHPLGEASPVWPSTVTHAWEWPSHRAGHCSPRCSGLVETTVQ